MAADILVEVGIRNPVVAGSHNPEAHMPVEEVLHRAGSQDHHMRARRHSIVQVEHPAGSTEGRVICLNHEEGAVLVEVAHTVEAAARREEGLVDGPKTIAGDSGEYPRRTKFCSCCRTAPSSPLAMAGDQD